MKRIHIITDYGVEGWVPVCRWHAAARILGQNAVLFFAVIGLCWTVASLLWP
jgi:hypothetical protein